MRQHFPFQHLRTLLSYVCTCFSDGLELSLYHCLCVRVCCQTLPAGHRFQHTPVGIQFNGIQRYLGSCSCVRVCVGMGGDSRTLRVIAQVLILAHIICTETSVVMQHSRHVLYGHRHSESTTSSSPSPKAGAAAGWNFTRARIP